MSYGPTPWQQTNWDARAAANFIAGGAGSGLIVFAGLDAIARGARPAPALLLVGLALVGLGLACVWLEIGRPLRALNVFIALPRSWMSREALVAVALFAAGGATLVGVPGGSWLAAALALAFVYCQARILLAARGIPAWREPALTPFIVVTGLAEGAGLLLFATPLAAPAAPAMVVAFGALLLLRLLAWFAYGRRVALARGALLESVAHKRAVARRAQRRLADARPPLAPLADPRSLLAPGAAAALEHAGRALVLAGALAPLALVAAAMAFAFSEGAEAALLAAAGLVAALAGGYVKYAVVMRAGFNQGFTLAHLPVRGART